MASRKEKCGRSWKACPWERVGEKKWSPSSLVGVRAECGSVLLEKGVPSLGPQLPLPAPSSQWELVFILCCKHWICNRKFLFCERASFQGIFFSASPGPTWTLKGWGSAPAAWCPVQQHFPLGIWFPGKCDLERQGAAKWGWWPWVSYNSLSSLFSPLICLWVKSAALCWGSELCFSLDRWRSKKKIEHTVWAKDTSQIA